MSHYIVTMVTAKGRVVPLPGKFDSQADADAGMLDAVREAQRVMPEHKPVITPTEHGWDLISRQGITLGSFEITQVV